MRRPHISRQLLLPLFALLVSASVGTIIARGILAPSASASPVRGQAGDLQADVILGQPDFSEINPGPIVPDKLWLPHGVIADNGHGKFYVFDAGDNRILGFDNSCLAVGGPRPCTANKVLGQPNMNTSACNGDSGYQSYPNRAPASAATLCGEHESQLSISEGGSGASMALDSAGNLYVTDFWNRRVLKYNNPYGTDTAHGEGDGVADDVWGQADFSGNKCNKGMSTPDATSLCFTWGNSNNWTAGVDIGPDGALWVVDSGNNRVLRFPAGSKTADLVLGQPNFNSTSSGSAANQMYDPSAVRVSSDGWVYVADHANHRVSIFKPPFSNGMAATFSRTFYNAGSPPSPSEVSGLDLDPTQPGTIWVTNQGKNTIELWDKDLQNEIAEAGIAGNGNLLGDATGSVGIDSQGNLLVAIGIGDHSDDVLLLRKTSNSPPTYDSAGHESLFYANQRVRTNRDLIGGIPGVEWSKSPTNQLGINSQLVVADNGRILFWNNPDPATMSNYAAADGYLSWLRCDSNGQNCHSVISGFNSADGACCTALKVSDNYLWAATYPIYDDPERILVWQLPLKPGDLPVKEIRLPLTVLGGGQTIQPAGLLWGLAPTSDGGYLWVSQGDASRVFRVRQPLSDAPLVDVVLGQTSASGTACNGGGSATGATLCYPGALSFDRLGNLWVSDQSLEGRGNFRLLEFNSQLLPPNNPVTLYAPVASKIFPNTAAWETAFSSTNNMVVGYNPYSSYPNPQPPNYTGECIGWCGGRFPGVYNNPLGASTTPDSFLKDYYSIAMSASFDDQDNLFVSDINRSRVLVYRKPFQQPAPVGGIAELPDAPRALRETAGSSHDLSAPFAAIAGTVAAIIAAGTAGAWCGRRRWRT